MVEDFFAWAKQQAAECAVPPKSRTGQGLNFIIHQENYLKVFLTVGERTAFSVYGPAKIKNRPGTAVSGQSGTLPESVFNRRRCTNR